MTMTVRVSSTWMGVWNCSSVLIDSWRWHWGVETRRSWCWP